MPFYPLHLENRMTVCMEIPGDDPTKGEPENAAGRGQEIHAERTAIHLMWTFCLHEVSQSTTDIYPPVVAEEINMARFATLKSRSAEERTCAYGKQLYPYMDQERLLQRIDFL